MHMRRRATMIAPAIAACVLGPLVAASSCQPRTSAVSDEALREYAGVYQLAPDAFLYLQLWSELSGKNQLVAFEESGEVRALYPTDRDRFFAGPGAAVPTGVESRVEFLRDRAGKVASLTWKRDGVP